MSSRVVLAVLVLYVAPANGCPVDVMIAIIIVATLIAVIIATTTLSITEHPLTQVSLQRLEQFLLESETERLDSFIQGTPAPPSECASDLGPKIVMRNASFGPAAGKGAFRTICFLFFNVSRTYAALRCTLTSHRDARGLDDRYTAFRAVLFLTERDFHLRN